MIPGVFGAFVLITVILLILPNPLRKGIIWAISRSYISFLNLVSCKIQGKDKELE